MHVSDTPSGSHIVIHAGTRSCSNVDVVQTQRPGVDEHFQGIQFSRPSTRKVDLYPDYTPKVEALEPFMGAMMSHRVVMYTSI